jgi:perosamine synthetase
MPEKPITIADTRLTESEMEAAVRVLRSGMLRQGKECEAFEAEFAARVGARFAITCANGTAALHLAYLTFLKPGDEVLVPSFTFIATASMVTFAGGRPVFCDVDPESFLMDLEDAATRISPRTRALAPVHLFGNVCDISRFQDFARRHGLVTVWDAAQAHGATYQGRDVGSFGDLVCYSFYPTKNLFVGEGGMVCTDNPEYAQIIGYLRTHGQTGPYLHTMLGLNYRMTDVEAAIGREQLKRLDKMLARRRRNAALLNEGLKTVPGLKRQTITPGTESAWHQYCILVDPQEYGKNRNELAAYLRLKGIATGVHYPRGLHQQPIFQQMYGESHLPHTEYLAENILALPVHHGLTDEDIGRIVDAVQSGRG